MIDFVASRYLIDIHVVFEEWSAGRGVAKCKCARSISILVILSTVSVTVRAVFIVDIVLVLILTRLIFFLFFGFSEVMVHPFFCGQSILRRLKLRFKQFKSILIFLLVPLIAFFAFIRTAFVVIRFTWE